RRPPPTPGRPPRTASAPAPATAATGPLRESDADVGDEHRRHERRGEQSQYESDGVRPRAVDQAGHCDSPRGLIGGQSTPTRTLSTVVPAGRSRQSGEHSKVVGAETCPRLDGAFISPALLEIIGGRRNLRTLALDALEVRTWPATVI